jgi:hypothetical protein
MDGHSELAGDTCRCAEIPFVSEMFAPLSQMTTAQQFGSIVKSARDIMRKDKGLNGELDRLPMLTWIMF